MSAWYIEGQYMETCNCAFLCPCISSNLTAKPTEGDCKAAVAMQIDKGEKDGIVLDDLAFIVLLHSPGPMIEGNLKVGLIIDDKANEDQLAAISAIATGSEGGPMAALAPLVGEVVGVEQRLIRFEKAGMSYTVKAGELVEQTLEGLASAVKEGEPLYLENAFHPVSSRLALARATSSKFHAFGIDWEDSSGTRNGHFAPFSWSA